MRLLYISKKKSLVKTGQKCKLNSQKSKWLIYLGKNLHCTLTLIFSTRAIIEFKDR